MQYKSCITVNVYILTTKLHLKIPTVKLSFERISEQSEACITDIQMCNIYINVTESLYIYNI